MTRFERAYFQKLKFSQSQLERYLENALRDMEIARKDAFNEVRFNYAYQALIKAGIVLLAKAGQVKTRSVPGHHLKILTKTSEILNDPDIFTIGNAMRMKRNQDFYSGGEFVGRKETDDYLRFVGEVIEKVKRLVLS